MNFNSFLYFHKLSSAILSIISVFKGALAKLKTQHQEEPSSPTLASNKPTLLRALFTVGALCRHFDFDQEQFKGANKVNTTDIFQLRLQT